MFVLKFLNYVNYINVLFILPSGGDFVCDVKSDSGNFKRVVTISAAFNVVFSISVIQSPLPSSIDVPFSHKSYLNPSGLTT